MHKREAVVLLSAGVVTATAGFTWLFGAVALAACGVAMVIAALFVDVGSE